MRIKGVDSTKRKAIANVLMIVCALTNLSQMPFFVEHQITRFVSIPIWLLMAVYCVVNNDWRVHYGHVSAIVGLGCTFAVLYFVVGMFIPEYNSSALPIPIFMCVFIAMVGAMIGEELDDNDVQNLITVYILSGLIVCLDVFVTYIYGRSLAGPFYLYSSKNSVSQILLTVWILILLFKIGKVGKIKTAVYIVAFAFLTFCMFALKSRASIVGMPIVMIGILLTGRKYKGARNFIILILVAFVILMLQDNIYDIIVNDIIFAGRDSTNIDSLTSGRASEWMTFWEDLNGHFFLGNGRMKRESLILTSILEFGFIGGGIVLLLALYPIYWGLKNLSKTDPMYLCFMSVAVVYVLNGLFEQLAPFGPGVKCYFLWMMLGILAANRAGRNKNVFRNL